MVTINRQKTLKTSPYIDKIGKKEFADLMGLSVPRFRSLLDQGALPPPLFNGTAGHQYWRRSVVEKFIASL